MFFKSWDEVARVLVQGALAYVALVAFLRVSGKRTLSKMNAFDLVVTVALGSTLATVMLSKDVTVAQGLAAFFVLVWGQLAVTWLSVRSSRFQNVVKSRPTLLFFQGAFFEDAMRDQRVTHEELGAAVRSQGKGSWEEVAGVVLETDGSFSVLTSLGGGRSEVLELVAGYPTSSGASSSHPRKAAPDP